MRTDAKQHIHFAVNFIVAPTQPVVSSAFINFQSALGKPERGLCFDQAIRNDDGTAVQLIRGKSPLQVAITQVGPGVSQLSIVAERPSRLLDDFIDDAESVCEAFFEAWPGEKTVVARTGALRSLYPLAAGAGGHAFQFLWERRLHQADNAIKVFERPILGGGIRLVFPPVSDDGAGFEVKIESYLQDPKQLFVESTAVWRKPLAAGELPDPRMILQEIQQFADGPVEQFIVMES